jgi:ParB family chromosome partitioning protein
MEGQSKQIPFSSIIIDNEVVENARVDWQKEVKALAANIWEKGLLNPLTVAAQGKQYVLVAGFRRYSAISSLQKQDGFADRFSKVPAVVVEGDKQQLQQYNLIENLQRTDLTPAETANGMSKLRDLGMTQKEIAGIIGKTQAYVSQLLKLVDNLVDPAWLEFSRGNISVTDALELATLDKKEQNEKMGVLEDAIAESGDEDIPGAKKPGKSKAKENKRKAREAILPGGNRPKFVIAAKKATALVAGIKEHGINPRHEKDSYVDGVVDAFEGLLGVKDFPFESLEPAKPKKKAGRPKKVKAEDVEDVDDDAVDDVIDEE